MQRQHPTAGGSRQNDPEDDGFSYGVRTLQLGISVYVESDTTICVG